MVIGAMVDPNVLSCPVPIIMRDRYRSGLVLGRRVRRRPIPISWARPTPPLRGRARQSLSLSPRARRRLALSPRARPCPPQRRRARRRLALSPRARPCPPQRRRARRNQTPVVQARNATAPLSVQKFLSFGSYWFHLLGYPSIRSPTAGFQTGDGDDPHHCRLSPLTHEPDGDGRFSSRW